MIPKLFVPFSIRNKIINENKNKDISDFDDSEHYNILSSYMSENKIYQAFEKRKYDGLLKNSKANFGVSFDNFKKGISDTIRDVKYTLEHPYASLNCGFIINPYVFAAAGIDDTGLKAYWKWNESSGDIINQSQSAVDLGTAADIQITGATYSQTGQIGNALLFDGVNDFGVAGSSLSQFNFAHESQITISFWMKLVSTPGGEEVIIDNNNASTANKGFSVRTNSLKQFLVQPTNGTAFIYLHTSASSYIPDTTNWYFYVWRSDVALSTNTSKIRRNDANESTANRSNTAVNGDSANALNFGRQPSGSLFSNILLDETAVWSNIMSSSLETTLYNSGSGSEIY